MMNTSNSAAVYPESGAPLVSSGAIPVVNERRDGGEIILDHNGFNPQDLFVALQREFPQRMKPVLSEQSVD